MLRSFVNSSKVENFRKPRRSVENVATKNQKVEKDFVSLQSKILEDHIQRICLYFGSFIGKSIEVNVRSCVNKA